MAGDGKITLHNLADLRSAFDGEPVPIVPREFVLPRKLVDDDTLRQFHSLSLIDQFSLVHAFVLGENPNRMKERYSAEVIHEALSLSQQQRQNLKMQIIVVGSVNENGALVIKDPRFNTPMVYLVVEREGEYQYLRADRISLLGAAGGRREEIDNHLRNAEKVIREHPADTAVRLIRELSAVNKEIGDNHILVSRRLRSDMSIEQSILTRRRGKGAEKLEKIKDELILAFIQVQRKLYPTLPDHVLQRLTQRYDLTERLYSLELGGDHAPRDILHANLLLVAPVRASEQNSVIGWLLHPFREPHYGPFSDLKLGINVAALRDGEKAYVQGSQLEEHRVDYEICQALGL